ncbi:MAG: beta-lactamase family protein [Gemmatimonadaceae bacterium]|jgi:CubicO group peptidase (beta-lactamase class C family)|nr:beta-lactamase family protein [Gemmatimonadaceae bacterium]
MTSARRWHFAVALSFLAACHPVIAQSPLAVAMDSALRTIGVPGATWALVRPDGVALGAAGVRDLVTGRPMHAADRVHVASVTKTVLATGALRLVTLGRLALDAPITRYLPALPIDNAWDATDPIRVRHLLDHTAGLDDARFWQVFTMRGDPDLPLRDALVHAGARVTVRQPPGTRFSYSNTGYLLLAMVVEAVTGERYEQWMDRELLAPLGMTRSTFHFVSQVGPARDTTLAMGHFEGGTRQTAYAIPARPSSQFTTTAADMATLARFLMSDGMRDGQPFVATELLRSMGRATTTDAARGGVPGGYGLGLVSRERWGVSGRCHLGNLGTFRSLFCLYPDVQRAFFWRTTAIPRVCRGIAWIRCSRTRSICHATLLCQLRPPRWTSRTGAAGTWRARRALRRWRISTHSPR